MPRRAKLYEVFGLNYKFYGPQEKACAYYLAASQETPSLFYKWDYYSEYLFATHYTRMTQEEHFLAHCGYNELFKDIWQFRHDKMLHRQHKKIRIGYLSSDFKKHVVLLFIYAMLTRYDCEQFEVYCFSNSHEDVFTNLLKPKVDEWIGIHELTAPDAAKEIYRREIDILFELGGHAHNNLPIFAYKPAPIQLCGIGYFATTGLKAVDYFLMDKYFMAGDAAKYFVEKPLIMPESHFCFTPLNDMPRAVKGAPCKEKGYITFGSFNDPLKINMEVLQAWGRVLVHVPKSRLLLKGRVFDVPHGIENMQARLREAGIDEARVELRGFTREYLPEYWDMDIALDTFPYPGGGTTCDALYMGVPVVTLSDGSFGGSFGISLLKNVGLDICCTYTTDEYVERAVLLAQDYDILDTLHRGLRDMVEDSPVRDEEGYVRALEDRYREIFQRYAYAGI